MELHPQGRWLEANQVQLETSGWFRMGKWLILTYQESKLQLRDACTGWFWRYPWKQMVSQNRDNKVNPIVNPRLGGSWISPWLQVGPQVLQMEQVHTISLETGLEIQVYLIDANHVPGSVMFLFSGSSEREAFVERFWLSKGWGSSQFDTQLWGYIPMLCS